MGTKIIIKNKKVKKNSLRKGINRIQTAFSHSTDAQRDDNEILLFTFIEYFLTPFIRIPIST